MKVLPSVRREITDVFGGARHGGCTVNRSPWKSEAPATHLCAVPPRHKGVEALLTDCRLGRAFLLLLLASRTVVWTVGCAPAAGSEGGQCISSDGCSSGYCNEDGLQCDNRTNTCFAPPPPGPPGAPTISMQRRLLRHALRQRCSVQLLRRCEPESRVRRSADRRRGVHAVLLRTDVQWFKLQCLPVRESRSAYACDDPLTPESVDASPSCLSFPPSSESRLYCCAPPNTCFAALKSYYNLNPLLRTRPTPTLLHGLGGRSASGKGMRRDRARRWGSTASRVIAAPNPQMRASMQGDLRRRTRPSPTPGTARGD